MSLSSLKQLFRYELLDDNPSGKGGCGVIWPARDILFARQVALKTINEPLFLRYPDTAKRAFVREAIAGARLGELSANVVRVFDLGIIETTPYFVMEWIESAADDGTLDLASRSGNLSLSTTKGILIQIASVLQLAHSKGIIHSDIAPANILYDASTRLYKLADFGLLKIVEEQLVSQGSGSLLKGGRVDFQPPEVLVDIDNITYSADVYALAVTLRVLLEGDGCLRYQGGRVQPTPGVIRVKREQRDAPDQVRQLLTRFIDGHTHGDTAAEFIEMLQRIPT